MREWKRAVQLTVLLAAAVLFAMPVGAQEEEGGGGKKKRERAKPAKMSGTVVEVKADERKLVVSVDGKDETIVVGKKSTITLRGPLLDGIKKGDSIEMDVAEQKGTKTLRKATVTREVEPAKKGKNGGRGGRKKKRKKGGDEEGGAGADADGDI